jgi:hypothetical protein
VFCAGAALGKGFHGDAGLADETNALSPKQRETAKPLMRRFIREVLHCFTCFTRCLLRYLGAKARFV